MAAKARFSHHGPALKRKNRRGMSASDVGIPVPVVQRSAAKRRGGLLQNYFYFAMALAIPAIVVFGFSFTIGRNLIHPAIPRPWILYVHAVVFSGWLVFFLWQSALVRTEQGWARCFPWWAWQRRSRWAV
jgi:hypothetical protein